MLGMHSRVLNKPGSNKSGGIGTGVTLIQSLRVVPYFRWCCSGGVVGKQNWYISRAAKCTTDSTLSKRYINLDITVVFRKYWGQVGW